MKSLTVDQMREADRRCIQDLGIPGPVLMNNAGASVFKQIERGPVGLVCGKGNNGGDGFVVARMALLAGYHPRVVLVADPEAIQGDAAVFMRVYQRLGGPLTSVDGRTVADAVAGLRDCAVVVDAVLGTGTRGEVHGSLRTAIESWPEVHTVAVDLPSGMNADMGEPCGCCVRADVTVTFQFPKRGFDNPDAKKWLGRLVVADIGIPPVCADDNAWAALREKSKRI